MSYLRQIFDGLTEHSSDKWEPYFDVYERYLGQFSGLDMNLVEVGTQKGGSLDMWSQYFGEGSSIVGIDVDPECANLKYDRPNIKVVIGDQGKPEFWDEFLKEHTKIDIFIDDGGHFMDQQILTFEKVFPVLSPGGIFICEDCHTSYMSYNGGGLERKNTFINYAKSYVDVLHYNWKEGTTSDLEIRRKIGKDLSSIHFYDSMVVFEKFTVKEMKRVHPVKFS
jgi:hypothetical protein